MSARSRIVRRADPAATNGGTAEQWRSDMARIFKLRREAQVLRRDFDELGAQLVALGVRADALLAESVKP